MYGFSSNEIAVVKLRQGGRRGIVSGAVGDPTVLARPTTAVLAAGALYSVNGRFSTPPTPTTQYGVIRTELP